MAEQKYTCIRCGKTFTSQQELTEHEKTCKEAPKSGTPPGKEKK
jgi:transposase-like protein